jgi:hypothetical protein
LPLDRDLDGFFSGLLAYHQLQKQGINPNNIKISFAQYGDEENELIQKVETHNKQFAVVVDFASLPTANIFDIINKMSGYKIGDDNFIKYLKTASRGNLKNKAGFRDFTRKFLGNEEISDEDLEKLNRALGNFDFSKAKNPVDKKDYDVSLTKPDFVSDHHQNAKGNLTAGKSGKIGKTEFGSDTEHMAVAYAPNIADYSTIEAITRIDSAKYTRLEDTLELPKDFRNKGRMERLAILLNSMLPEILKRNQTLAVEILKKSSPSLVSVYNNTRIMGKYNDQQVEILEELNKVNPDWNKISSLRSGMPKSMAKETTKEQLQGKKKLKTIEDWREKGEEDLKKAKSGYWTREDQKKLDMAKENKSLSSDEQDAIRKQMLLVNGSKEKIKKMDALIKSGKEETYINGMNKQTFYKAYEQAKDYLKELEDRLGFLMKGNEREKEALEEKKEKNKSQFTTVGNVMRQNATATRDYPSRYLGQVLNKSGVRYPFILKRFATMMQVALNPDAPEEFRKRVDLGKISNQIIENIQKKFGNMYNNWAFDVIKKESGGHSAITNISRLGTLGLMPKKNRERYSELEALNKRALASGTSLSKIEDKVRSAGKLSSSQRSLWQEFKDLKEKRTNSAKERTEIMDEIEKEFYKELKKYSTVITKKQSNPSKYDISKVEESLEESLFDVADELLR